MHLAIADTSNAVTFGTDPQQLVRLRCATRARVTVRARSVPAGSPPLSWSSSYFFDNIALPAYNHSSTFWLSTSVHQLCTHKSFKKSAIHLRLVRSFSAIDPVRKRIGHLRATPPFWMWSVPFPTIWKAQVIWLAKTVCPRLKTTFWRGRQWCR